VTPFDKGLPASEEAERFTLGAVLAHGDLYLEAAAIVQPEDFSTESRRRICKSMAAIQDRGEVIDRMTVYNELQRHGEAESVGGFSALLDLEEGIPNIVSIASWASIVRDKSLLRRIIFSSQNTMNRCLMGEEAPDQILAAAGETLLKLGDGRGGGQLASPEQIIDNHPGGISGFLDPSWHATGLPTGFAKFDEMTGGLHPGDLTIIAGRPGHGKTAWAGNVAEYVALKLKKTVAIFSLEMSKESLLNRLMCSVARVDGFRWRAGYTNADERRRLNRAMNEIIEAPLRIDDSATVNLMEIHSKLRRLKQERSDLALAIVDYLQLMGGGGRSENRTQEVSAQSRGFKLMAKALGIPIMVLSQLSRAPETRAGDHRPQLSDLRESGAIEQDADLVGFVYRPEMYDRDREELRGLAELIIGKQRNGPVGTVKLVFLHGQTKFENTAQDQPAMQELEQRND
jgi:replicative DNA helicase